MMRLDWSWPFKRKVVNEHADLVEQLQTGMLIMQSQVSALENEVTLWQSITGAKEGDLTNEQLINLRSQCYKFYYQNPIARAIINHLLFYIFGAGVAVTAQDINPDVQDYITECRKIDAGFKLSEMIFRTLRDGESFIRKFSDGNARCMSRRFIDPDNITSINTNEDDVTKTERYQWLPTGKTKAESIDAAEMQHVKLFVDSNVKRGRPVIEPVLSKIIKYDEWLNDRVILNRALSSVFLEIVVRAGSPSDRSAVRNRFQDTTAVKSSQHGVATKKPPAPGTIAIHGENEEWKWNSPDIKADSCKEDGRQIRLAIAAGVQMPEFMLTSDASNASYSSTLVSEAPFVRLIQYYQTQIFEPEIKQIYREDIEYGIRRKILPMRSTDKVLRESARKEKSRLEWEVGLKERCGDIDPKLERKLIEVLEDPDNYEDVVIPTKTDVDINWPPVVSRNIKEETDSYSLHDQMGYASKQTIAGRLGYDYEEERRLIKKEEMENESDYKPPVIPEGIPEGEEEE